jgi:hypothetical protein
MHGARYDHNVRPFLHLGWIGEGEGHRN